jgi:rSAM/selenodomain-associated transferase 1
MRCEIVVFGRVPMAGSVKSRLAAAIGPEAAAEVYRLLLDHVLAEARAAGPAVVLALADAAPAGVGWRPPPGVEVEIQAGEDLGARMRTAFDRRFAAGADAVVLVGSDLPGLTAGVLADARAALERAPVALGPSDDGGYWLVGQRRPGHDLFSGVPWSSPDVLDVTRRRLLELGIGHAELPLLRDLDTLADLEALAADPTLAERLRVRLGDLMRATGSRRQAAGAGAPRNGKL